ncbi:hypothetical protein ACFQMA_21430 [Halosimplex aquaticum]|uniref:DUF7344 domain-containing protein n=1 Tax=Halosimplex aquaticum TaxID=3026162 RepID=A0ABD5Y7U6_9EURY|nr:hypothetical protein [Halosimplex aquaticum]
MAGGDAEDDLDTAFELLSDRRRRAVIEVLRTAPRGSLEFSALADAVAAVTDDDVADLAPALYYSHLPKLDAADVVDFDAEAGVVDYDSEPFIERCLDVAGTHGSEQWTRRCSK